jgi:hypothetical protein
MSVPSIRHDDVSSDSAMCLTRTDYIRPYEDYYYIYEGLTGMPVSRVGHGHRTAGSDLIAGATSADADKAEAP